MHEFNNLQSMKALSTSDPNNEFLKK
jgi:hypothetical protein